MLNLPSLVVFSDYDNDMKKYIEVLYDFFKKDFIDSRPDFDGRRMGLKKHPMDRGKEVTFWHFITSADNGAKQEKDRYPDFPRCERIRWPKVIIENHNDDNVHMWETWRGRNKRICLCYGDWEYMVVLEDRGEYLLPWTAFDVRYSHQRKKLQREYDAYKAKTAS